MLIKGATPEAIERLALLRQRFADEFFELITEPGYCNEADYDMNSVATAQRGGRITYGMQVHDMFVRLCQGLRYTPEQIDLLEHDYFFRL